MSDPGINRTRADVIATAVFESGTVGKAASSAMRFDDLSSVIEPAVTRVVNVAVSLESARIEAELSQRYPADAAEAVSAMNAVVAGMNSDLKKMTKDFKSLNKTVNRMSRTTRPDMMPPQLVPFDPYQYQLSLQQRTQPPHMNGYDRNLPRTDGRPPVPPTHPESF